jgi:hypothetical protein
MIGAIPVGNSAPAEAIVRRSPKYVLQLPHVGGSNLSLASEPPVPGLPGVEIREFPIPIPGVEIPGFPKPPIPIVGVSIPGLPT